MFVCEFEQMQQLCIHLAASIDSRRYTNAYMAVLYNDSTWIDNELREQLQSAQVGINADQCGSCKNVIQSSADFYLQILVSVVYIIENDTREDKFSKRKADGGAIFISL